VTGSSSVETNEYKDGRGTLEASHFHGNSFSVAVSSEDNISSKRKKCQELLLKDLHIKAW
jgi:hypothetical protein